MYRLFRLPNLFIVFFTQYVLQYGILSPAYLQAGLTSSLDHFHFFLLMLCTVLIAAGGYVINDVEDFDIDVINKPERTVIGKHISKAQAMQLYLVINLTGLLIALYLAVHIQAIGLVLLFPAAVSLLYLYSLYFKKQVFTGNILVSLFCAFVAGIVWFAERQSFAVLADISPNAAREVAQLIGCYMGFGFLSNLFREIVKDIEDMEGDQKHKCRTLPIVFGMQIAAGTAAVTGVLLLILLGWWAFLGSADLQIVTTIFLLIGVVVPLLFSIWFVLQAREKTNYSLLSKLAKYIMLSGLFLLLIYSLETYF